MILESKRLTLRFPVEADDVYLQRILSDPGTMNDLPYLLKDWTLEDVQQRRLRQTAGHPTGEACNFSMVLKDDPNLPVIGSTGMNKIDKVNKDGSSGINAEYGSNDNTTNKELLSTVSCE
eukprot:TRINITY_DN3946_c0_g1_i3.p1 TRINITY_DN3946_c0_g1~~TRINITY_DN3946_c0_g1_i3.p1  ORF type:complete len:120 (-),score=17.98 TRINITY_DN3946_c0_g1_i3:440-799(-)